jgi:hypothetical protein
LVAAVVTLIGGGGGVTTWRLLAAGDRVVSVHSSSPPATTPTSTAQTVAATVPGGRALALAVGDIDRLLVRSKAGRTAALQQRDYAAALHNRRVLLVELDRLTVPAQPSELAHAAATLRAALRASARADAEHLACGCDALQPGDVEAQRLKRRFAALFNPLAVRYLGHEIDPDQI